MMIFRFLKRIVFLLLILVVVLLAPVGWNEVACRGNGLSASYDPLITDPAQQRSEARTYLTYPEWHIVHAYDDYAKLLEENDPHDYNFFRSIKGFWTSLCALSRESTGHGGFDWEMKQTLYTIGVSFTAEMALKAAYEETLGRIATMIRGEARAPMDDFSAAQLATYAEFLQQTPWYLWDFRADAARLDFRATDVFRDQERRIALGLEYRTKAIYADAIAAAAAAIGADEQTLQSVVTGISQDDLAATDGVSLIGPLGDGFLIETGRYRQFTRVVAALTAQGADFIEIAGNDDILLTALTDTPNQIRSLAQVQRQGYGDFRHLVSIEVKLLGPILRSFQNDGVRLEHVHDY